MPTTTKKPPKSPKPPLASTPSKALGGVTGKGFMPGVSGNLAGRPQGDGVVRKLILEAFKSSRAKALDAIKRRLESPKTVQDVLELLARLEGELVKDAGEGKGGISVIVIRGDGAISPTEFREAAQRRMAIEAKATVVEPPAGRDGQATP